MNARSLPRLLVAAGLFAIAAGGCEIQPLTTGGGTTPGPSGTSQYCAAACTSNQRCDSSVVLTSCESACATSQGTRLAHLRSDWISAASSCLGAATCASWQNGTALTTCEDQATAAMTPGAAAQTYCQQGIAKDTACGNGGTSTVASCLEAVKTFDDASLGAATSCFQQTCDQYVNCARTALGL